MPPGVLELKLWQDNRIEQVSRVQLLQCIMHMQSLVVCSKGHSHRIKASALDHGEHGQAPATSSKRMSLSCMMRE